MRKSIGRTLRALHLDLLTTLILKTERLLGFQKRRNQKIIASYLRQTNQRKLHIGCGGNLLTGWLNSDFNPQGEGVLNMDATRAFPLGDNEFDYIFSEHMIEHITYAEGLQMLAECFRVLKDGGTIRISTPDLAFLVDLYRADKSDRQKEYIKWSTDKYIRPVHSYDDTFVINNFVRAWHHMFIYDEKILRSSMGKVGLTDVKRCALSESEDDTLKNLEHTKRMPDGFLHLETMTLEARKLTAS